MIHEKEKMIVERTIGGLLNLRIFTDQEARFKAYVRETNLEMLKMDERTYKDSTLARFVFDKGLEALGYSLEEEEEEEQEVFL